MSRRWLLSLLCLSVLSLSLVPLTRAVGELKVNEAKTRVLLEKQPAVVSLAVENSSGELINASIKIEFLDPKNNSRARATQVQSIKTGSQTVTVLIPNISFSEKDQSEMLWYRLRYRISRQEAPTATLTEGIISFSETASDLFDLRIATAQVAREGGRFHARVHASQPMTRRPAANVRVDGELTLEDDGNKSVKLRATKITNSEGYAVFDFTLPPRFPDFPHKHRSDGGEFEVTGQRGNVVAKATAGVMVDQFARVIISTDKPLYQPGQVMHVRAVLFSPSKRALANQDILIQIADPEGVTISRTVVKSSRFGVANVDWSIPENSRLGDYQVRVGVDGEEESSQHVYDVRLSRYDLPNFTVNVEPDRKFYLPGQNAEVKVRADYLFGQPVRRGHVRVVRETEREWNYREQKWDIKEGDKYEGKTDTTGLFVAHINLAEDHAELASSSYDRFDDATYAAYFTDPTTNRTEERRFDLRVTKEAIHIYVLNDWRMSRTLPLRFYLSTFYADGSPARCKVDVKLTDSSNASRNRTKKSLANVQTNRYGLAKVETVRVPDDFADESEANLIVSAADGRGAKGSHTEEISFGDEQHIVVDTDRALYRSGEPITVFVTSSVPDQKIVVDLASSRGLIRSERIQLHGRHASIVFPYRPEFKDELTIAAYPDFPNSQTALAFRNVLYPHNTELNVKVQTSQASYRPGEDAQLNLKVSEAEGGGAESALGVVVLDRAVEERFRTDREFGNNSYANNESVQNFLGPDTQVAGVTFRDLQRVDMSKPVSPEFDLLAEILLSQIRDYDPTFHGGDDYESDQEKVFGEPARKQVKPIRDALASHYLRAGDYPKNEAGLRDILLQSQIDLNEVRDAWGVAYRPVFSVNRQDDVLQFFSAGADKRFDTKDDFMVGQASWPYFRLAGYMIDQAVRHYHDNTGSFIRDFPTLKNEVAKDEFALDQMRDRWGQPYRFSFNVIENHYVIRVSSGGPDKKFAPENVYSPDDFVIWTSSIDYFAKPRAEIDRALSEHLNTTKRFPQNDMDLRAALPDAGELVWNLRDPWNRPYYRVFSTYERYDDRVRIEDRAQFGTAPAQRTIVTPVTRTIASLMLRSVGPDGKAGTIDDFTVATFSGVIAEQERGQPKPKPVTAGVVLSGTNGAIYGVVKDSTGAVIAGAIVTVTRTADGQLFTASTDEDGKYSIDLPPGMYEVRFQVQGFKASVVTEVLVRAANLTEINTRLEPGTVAESVMVTSDGPKLQTETAEASVIASRSTRRRGDGNFSVDTGGQISTPRLREYFPETLLWQPSIETDKQGRARINFKLADNITTWKLAVIGSTEDGRIGTAETEIKAFQPFFVDHDPPRVLTEGDEISLPVVVRNYLARAQKVDLEIKPEDWFSLLGPAHKRAEVLAGDATRETFDFRARLSVKDGKQRITATAGDSNDAIEKPITVHPDGEEISVTAGDILGSSTVLEANVPDTMIPNSKRAELKIYPNLMAHVTESVEAIMARPYGCGEQAISAVYPSLLLLRHYKKTGEDFPQRARAERYLNDGYSRLLNYRDEDGGFTYWGHGQPNVALTAYALRFMTDAADVIAVDEDVIKKTREWLIKQQQADGSWPAEQYWNTVEGNRRSIVLTAYVARVFATTSNSEAAASLKRALNFLGRHGMDLDEPHMLASYALAAMDSGDIARAKPIIDRLRGLALEEGTTTYWTLEANTPFYGWGLAGRVEATALVVKALSKYCESQGANCEADRKLINRGLLFLLKEKDRYGVWYSTQATINVLDAMLTLFAQNAANALAGSAAEVLVNGTAVQTLQMPAGNRLVAPITLDITQYVQKGKNSVEIKRPTGSPFASVQAVVNYYVPWSAPKAENHSNNLRLAAKFDKTEGKVNDEITCSVEAERIGFRGYGMMLAEIGVPPGADVDRASLETAMKSAGWGISQYDVLPDRVVVYLWPQGGGVKFNFKFRPRFALNAKTASSVVYDYYNPEARTVVPPSTFLIK